MASGLPGLIAKLIELGVSEWRKKEEARRCLVGILEVVQQELTRNWSSLKRAFHSSTEATFLMTDWSQASTALPAALADTPQLLHDLQQAYSHGPGPIDGKDRTEVLASWTDVGRALRAIEDFTERERLSHWSLTEAECRTPRGLPELLSGMPPPVATQIAQIWKRLQEALAAGQVRIYTLEEVTSVRDQRNPLREAEMRADARRRYGDDHCFELAEKVYEYWIEPDTRILFTIVRDWARPLVLVRLSGPAEEEWCPKRQVELATCRRTKLG